MSYTANVPELYWAWVKATNVCMLGDRSKTALANMEATKKAWLAAKKASPTHVTPTRDAYQ
jgi:hypothetical protein